ncbi:uncharacterized protein LOC114123598 [Aphis gossypii]|uniref:uncharacterized protein LOC114123598 n=1 Tax=Aphis gossypii TaxID=80765 RepID=UPI0021596D7F|nr:uncharacterized protein LOC114123598 [Aphis gossypii]
MPLFQLFFNGISVQRMFTRCMAFIHVCYLGTFVLIKVFKIIHILYFLSIFGLAASFNWSLKYFQIEANDLFLQNSDDIAIMLFSFRHSFIIDLLLIINFYLLKATFKKDIFSIDVWLVVHGMFFLYILWNIISIDVFNITYCIFILSYVCVYCIYLLLVVSFRMEERNNNIFHRMFFYFYRTL